MPPPINSPSLHLTLLPKPFNVLQLQPGETIPEEYLNIITNPNSSRFGSITRTSDEISLVIEAEHDTDDNATWRAIKIAGPMPFDLVGVVCNITAPLQTPKIGVFVVSTWNTDYVLVNKNSAEQAVVMLKNDGWVFQ